MEKPRIVIVGAGLAGLACGGALVDAGFAPRLLDKGRGAGGRCSSRRSSVGRFDHGAPALQVTQPNFAEAVERWRVAGVVVAAGQGSSVLGSPAMNSFVKYEAERLQAEFSVEVAAPQKTAGGWQIYSAGGHIVDEADIVVFAAPAPQTADRLPEGPLKKAAQSVQYAPTWTLMAAFEDGASGPDEAVLSPTRGPLELVISQADRPGRESGVRYVAHARADWTREHLEHDKGEVAELMLRALSDSAPSLGAPTHLDAHRWRYARVETAVGTPFGLDLEQGLATCGDWHLGPHAEDAWESGHALSTALVEALR
ncbi:MAG: NAD(P)-binding protein [Pseudomonadota bacterium]